MLQSTNRKYLYFTYAVFGALWLYVFLRAWFVSPLHDEVATFFHFIEPKNFWGENASLDANNHLLNSFLGWISYKIFGESFFFFRLPNVLSFALYFWGIYALLKNFDPLYRLITLTGIVSIPYILEYFAYSRGYGMSMACFVWILYFAKNLAERYSLKNLFGLLFFSFFALLANLSFLGLTCLTLVWILLQLILNFRSVSRSTTILTIAFIGAFLAAIYPVFSLGMKMKEAGTLYYGTLDGLWDVTGRTLSQYVLFLNLHWYFVFLGLTFLLLFVSLYLLWNKGLKKFLKSDHAVLAYYFFGALCVIVFLAEVLKVNYPEDRVGMYLVPLFLLLLANAIQNSKFKFLLLVYLLFTVSLLFHLSLNTSVFTPDERMNNEFYQAVKKELGEGKTLVGYPTMELTWAFHERSAERKDFMRGERNIVNSADIILMKGHVWDNNDPFYEVFAEERNARIIALRRVRPLKASPKALVSLQQASTNGEYLDLAVFPVQDDWKKKDMKIKISGTLKKQGNTEIESIVMGIADKNGQQTYYQSYDLRWYYGIAKNPVQFEINGEFYPFDDDAEIKIYLWNKYQYPMEVKDIFVTVSELK